jgi:trans-aconitate 2-methyltransferase
MPWNPDTYHKFQSERAAPFEDLVALIKVREGLRVIDLGCGTGELTRKLADRLPNSDVTGIDNSPQMLERAAQYTRPGLCFEPGTIETVTGEWDLVFSHAAIHWVDDHHALIPRLLAMLRPGGQLAVQMPSNHSHPTHQLITQLAGEEPFRTALGGWTRKVPVLGIEEYAELLYGNGGAEITVFEKIYPHILENADAMADWTSGTALVPYFERLTEPLKQAFMEEYRKRLRQRWPSSPVFYGFRRTLFAATREG